MSDSATGGYLRPSASVPLPGSLTLTQFIQSVLVGISGIDGTLVRPKWQIAPPKQPDILVNWIAFAVEINRGDANAYVAAPTDDDGPSELQRQEELDVKCSFYGPEALENISVFRDGFQIQQNLEAMRLANMGFKGISEAISSADLFNERWYNRFEVVVTLVRQVQRTYQVLPFASARGTIHTVLDGEEQDITWQAEAP